MVPKLQNVSRMRTYLWGAYFEYPQMGMSGLSHTSRTRPKRIHKYQERRNANSILINNNNNRGAHGASSGILKPLGFLTEKLPLQALAKWREHVTGLLEKIYEKIPHTDLKKVWGIVSLGIFFVFVLF